MEALQEDNRDSLRSLVEGHQALTVERDEAAERRRAVVEALTETRGDIEARLREDEDDVRDAYRELRQLRERREQTIQELHRVNGQLQRETRRLRRSERIAESQRARNELVQTLSSHVS